MKHSWTNSLNLSFILKWEIVVQRVETSNALILLYCWSILPVLSSFMTYPRCVTRVTRRVPLVERELLNLPGHLSSPLVLVGFVSFDLLFSVKYFVYRCLSFCPFLLAIVLYVLLQFKVPDYPFGNLQSRLITVGVSIQDLDCQHSCLKSGSILSLQESQSRVQIGIIFVSNQGLRCYIVIVAFPSHGLDLQQALLCYLFLLCCEY